MRRLALAANDREVEALDTKRVEHAQSILRIMSNLFTGSTPQQGQQLQQQKSRRVSEHSRPTTDDTSNNFSLLPVRRSTVYIKDASVICGIDVAVARDYVFPSSDDVSICKKNAEIAKFHGRLDHERLFGIFQVLVGDVQKPGMPTAEFSPLYSLRNPLTVTMMEKL